MMTPEDHERVWIEYFDEQFERDAVRREAAARFSRDVAQRLRVRVAGARARAMREARERAGATCP